MNPCAAWARCLRSRAGDFGDLRVSDGLASFSVRPRASGDPESLISESEMYFWIPTYAGMNGWMAIATNSVRPRARGDPEQSYADLYDISVAGACPPFVPPQAGTQRNPD